ncbi:cyclic pyranopterin monophosphate synthase [Litorimonas cladophorae]|uniref:GTP 3',8-cyclase n=1 Tax=Litorimonas cladophorae TaxID=1220491 RepID=A0A918KIT5_9PROT|nr:GTP 3',8-cyclase MoaA [Litorimonas cladophorae]GGX62755.1 cyclic pyranopterin monophosphate synthase [Litorimonas cladophorae]
MTKTLNPSAPLIDPFGRAITYLRLSVTDRCDLRCTYCMAENMTFLPKSDLLDAVELDTVASAFIARGVRKIRITGGEPLVRRNTIDIMHRISRHLGDGLDELTLTTNGTQLEKYAEALVKVGVRRINISLDTLDPISFSRITRGGRLQQVLDGIAAAQSHGLKIKLNVVVLKHENLEQLPSIIEWAHRRDIEVTLIEAMPMGEIEEDRFDQYTPLSDVQKNLAKNWTLSRDSYRTGGPSDYWRVEETGGRLGFITPMSNNFCGGCNRVRLTCTGRLFLCLGQSDDADLRAVLRGGGDIHAALDEAIARKPKSHDFLIDAPGQRPAVPRHMSMTGG